MAAVVLFFIVNLLVGKIVSPFYYFIIEVIKVARETDATQRHVGWELTVAVPYQVVTGTVLGAFVACNACFSGSCIRYLFYAYHVFSLFQSASELFQLGNKGQ